MDGIVLDFGEGFFLKVPIRSNMQLDEFKEIVRKVRQLAGLPQSRQSHFAPPRYHKPSMNIGIEDDMLHDVVDEVDHAFSNRFEEVNAKMEGLRLQHNQKLEENRKQLEALDKKHQEIIDYLKRLG